MIKRTLFLTIAALFISVFSFSQKPDAETDDLLFLLRQPEHIKQALKTVQQLQYGTEISTQVKQGRVVIIICGEAVKAFTGAEENEMVKEANRLNVSLVGCGLSLQKFQLGKNDLMPGVAYVSNGFVKAFELQKQGYLSVEL